MSTTTILDTTATTTRLVALSMNAADLAAEFLALNGLPFTVEFVRKGNITGYIITVNTPKATVLSLILRKCPILLEIITIK